MQNKNENFVKEVDNFNDFISNNKQKYLNVFVPFIKEYNKYFNEITGKDIFDIKKLIIEKDLNELNNLNENYNVIYKRFQKDEEEDPYEPYVAVISVLTYISDKNITIKNNYFTEFVLPKHNNLLNNIVKQLNFYINDIRNNNNSNNNRIERIKKLINEVEIPARNFGLRDIEIIKGNYLKNINKIEKIKEKENNKLKSKTKIDIDSVPF